MKIGFVLFDQAIQLSMEYNPEPPFVGGHPDLVPSELLGTMNARVFDGMRTNMEDALG